MDEKNKEVKEEFIKNEDGEEIVNPELLDDKEKDTPSDSSPEDKPDQGVKTDETDKSEEEISEEIPEEPEETSEVDDSVPAPVEGESPIERARRLEIERLRKTNRELKRKSLLGEDRELEVEKPVSPSKEIPEKEDITSKYDKDQLDDFRELFQSEANRLGYVKKEEFEKSSFESEAEDTLDEFLSEHKEYLPENDPNNSLWDAFREEYGLYKRPKSPKKFRSLLERIHNTITLDSGKRLNSAEVAAKQVKIKQASHGGTTIAKKTKTNSGLDSNLRLDMLKGYTQEELDELVT